MPKSALLLVLSVFSVMASCSSKVKSGNDIIATLEQFKAKEKFGPDEKLFYTGISDPALRPALTDRINRAADDFIEVANSPDPSDEAYREKIGTGLQRFWDVYWLIDTEDQERICHYYEELMDIVGLESSGGQLNRFMYGFDPAEPKGF